MRGVRDSLARWRAASLGHPLYQQMLQRYQALSARDQLALKGLALFLLLLVLVQGWLLPLHAWHGEAQRRYLSQLEDLRWMQAQAPAAGVAPVQARPAGQSLLGLVNQLAREHGLNVRRFEPLGESGIGLWLEQAAFDDTLAWLGALRGYGIEIEEFSASRLEQPGNVDVRVTLRE